MTFIVDQPETPETMDFENDYDFGPSPALDALTKDIENVGATGSSGGSHGSGLLKPLAPLSMSSGNKAPLPKLGKLLPPTLISIAEEPVVPVAKKNNENEAEKAARRAARKKEKALRNSKDGKSSRKSRDKSLRHSREIADESSTGAPNAADVSIDSIASVDVPHAISDAPMPASAASTVSSGNSSAPLVAGTVVEARFGGKGTWFKGAIAAVHETCHDNGSTSQAFDIVYDDGDKEFGVARIRVRRCGEEQPSGPLAPGTPCEARLGTKCYPATVTAAHMAAGDGNDITYSVRYADGDFEKHVARNLIFVQCEFPASCTDNAATESMAAKVQEPEASESTAAPGLASLDPVSSEPEADVPFAKEEEAPPVEASLANDTVPVPESTNASAPEGCASEPAGQVPSAAVSTSAAIAEPSVDETSTVVADDSDTALSSANGSSKGLVDSDLELASQEAVSVVESNSINNEVSLVYKKLSLTLTEGAVPTDLANETVTEEEVAVAKKLFAEPTDGLREEFSTVSANATSAEVGSSSAVEVAGPVASADATSKEVAALELAPFVVGERVEGRYGGGEEWFLGHITAVHRLDPSSSTATDVGGGSAATTVGDAASAIDGSTFDVAYDDGDHESGVVALRLRRQGDEALKVLPRGTRCEARYGGGLKCYPGTITATSTSPSNLSSSFSATAGTSYTIAYDDEDEEVRVARELIFVQCGPLEWRKQQMLANAKLLLDERSAQSQEPNQRPHSVAEEKPEEPAPVAAANKEVTSEPHEEAQEEVGNNLVKSTVANEPATPDVSATAGDGPNLDAPEPQPLPASSAEPLKPLQMAVEPAPATDASEAAATSGEFMGMLGSPPPLKVLLAHAKKLGVNKSQCSGGSLAAQWAQVPKAVQQLVVASLQAPLPAGWALQPDEPATRYLNQWTNQGQPQHPLDDYYREKIQEFIRDFEETTNSNLLEQAPPQETIKPCPAAQQEIEIKGDINNNCASEGPVGGVASVMATAEAAAAAAVSAAASMAKELAVSQAQVASLSAELKVAQQTIQDLQQQQQHKEETESEVQESKDSVQQLQDSIQNRKSSRQSSFGKFFSALRGRRNEKIVPWLK